MNPFHLPTDVVDRRVYERTVAHLKELGVALPRFGELAEPNEAGGQVAASVKPDPGELFRVHWYNAAQRVAGIEVPQHIELPRILTGVDARIFVMVGRHFPMIAAHKVLAAYACLVPRLVTGAFDPARNRAVWPSTGNYCRGGIAISRILGCHGVAVLPEGMSRERFDWLEQWVLDPADIVRTAGSESNVKEIYDACAALARQPENLILNQFSEFPNYLAHFEVTGRAAGRLYEAYNEQAPGLRLAAFVSATGSAGTLAAGDRLKSDFGSATVAVEPVECPTMLYNGYGEHNIQGIGDKHVPLIHNVMNTDLVVAVSDEATDDLNVLFNTEEGQRFLIERKGVESALVSRLDAIGLSGIGNVLAAIKTARRLALGENDMIVTVATDGAELYGTERTSRIASRFHGRFDEVEAAETFGSHLRGGEADHVLELSRRVRARIFNLGYYTWVEQQGIALEDFDRRREQTFWKSLPDYLPAYDVLIDRINHDTGQRRPA